MIISKKLNWYLVVLLIIGFSLSSCGLFSQSESDLLPSSTATPTDVGGLVVEESPTPKHPCEGLSGTLELQILVGPSEAVGLVPVSVGHIPFIVAYQEGAFVVNGGGPLEYYEEVLELEKGTYTVTFAGETAVFGECISSGDAHVLNLTVEFTGEQMVEVDVEGFQGSYPWEGTNTMDVALPMVDGASQGGEGWTLVLHLD